MKYLLCGIFGVIVGFLIFYLLFRIANKEKLRKMLQEGKVKKKIPKPNFTKAVLVAVLSKKVNFSLANQAEPWRSVIS